MRKRMKKATALFLCCAMAFTLCLAVSPAASATGDASASPSPAASAADASASPSSAASPAASVSGKTLKIGVTEDVDSLNPFVAYTVASYEVFLLTYDTLVAFDKDMNPVGALAESWETSSDGLTWTFHLRKGVKWQDGEPFTSADVKYSYDTYLTTGMGMYAQQLKGITDVSAPDDSTVVIKTEKPKANMLYLTAPILPVHIWGGVSTDDLANFDNSKCIGTGAFKMVGWTNGDNCTLEANPDYFGGAPQFDGVIFKVYSSTDTMAQSVKLGEIDVAENLSATQAKNAAADSGGKLQVFESELNSIEDLGFNCKAGSTGSAALQNPVVRRAIDTAIDKQKIIDLAYSGGGEAGTTIIPPINVPWHYEPTGDEAHSYDPQKAGQLLDQAGYSAIGSDGIRQDASGNKLQLRLYARSDSSQEVRACQMIQSYLQDIHVGVTMSSMDDDALMDKISGADYDMFVWGWTGDVDPTTLLNVITTGEIGNLSETYYSNSQYDSLAALQATQLDQSARKDTIDQAQKLAYQDSPYSVLMYEKGYEVVRADAVTGLVQTCSGKGPIFYSNTTYNYLHGSFGGDKTASSASSASGPVLWIVLAAAAVVVVVLAVRSHRKKNAEDEE